MSRPILIVGAGIVGCSLAYHLSQQGVTDIIVVDRGTFLKLVARHHMLLASFFKFMLVPVL